MPAPRRLVPDRTDPVAPAATHMTVTWGWFVSGLLLATILGALGGRYLTAHFVADVTGDLPRIAIIDPYEIASRTMSPGQPESGHHQVRVIAQELVDQGYIVLAKGGIYAAPAHFEVTVADGRQLAY